MEINYTWVIGLFTGFAIFIWTVYQYIDTRKLEQNLKEFENYHKLIKELVQPETVNGQNIIYLDRQLLYCLN